MGMTNLREKTDAELALLIRHRQKTLKVATEDLAEALAEQEGRTNGTVVYEAPEPWVPWFPQSHCQCCSVPVPGAGPFCEPCVALHGSKLAPRRNGQTTCERQIAMWEGYAEYNPDEGKPQREYNTQPSKEALAFAASFEGPSTWRGMNR